MLAIFLWPMVGAPRSKEYNVSETSKIREQQPADSVDVMLAAARIFGAERAAPAATFTSTPDSRYRY